MKPGEFQELEFLRHYFNAIAGFNRLERNMAYCIRSAAGGHGEPADFLRAHDLPYAEKLAKIRALADYRGLGSFYGDFLDAAERCRRFRNQLVHGDWQYLGHLPQPIHFHVQIPREENGHLSLADFARHVAAVEETGVLFSKMRKDHPIE